MKLNSFQIILDYQSLDKYKFEPWNNRRLHIKRLTGKAHPYTRSVVVGYGKLKVVEISKEEHEQSFRVG